MKIMKQKIQKLIKENNNAEEDLLQELNEEIPLDINEDNPIEADKKIEIANNTKPVERDNITSIINDIEEHDYNMDNMKNDASVLEKELTTENLKSVLNIFNIKYKKTLFLETESSDILKEEMKVLKDNFNINVFETIVQDLESVKNLFSQIIKLVNEREEDVTNLLRIMDKIHNFEELNKTYDLTNTISDIGTIRKFINGNTLENLLYTLLFFLRYSVLDLTKEDNEIFNMLNKDIEDQSSIKNKILNRIKNDEYTKEINKKTTTPHTAFGSCLDKEAIEYMDMNDSFIIKTDTYKSDITLFNLYTDINNFSLILTEIKNTLSSFKEEVTEDMKILETKYSDMISVVKASIINYNNPSSKVVEDLWQNLMLIRVYYITMMSRRISDRFKSHYVLIKLLTKLFNQTL